MAGLFHEVRSEDSYQKHFKDGTKIAEGGFGVVSPVINLVTGKVVAAIKRTDLEGRDQRYVDYSRKEVCSLSNFPLNQS